MAIMFIFYFVLTNSEVIPRYFDWAMQDIHVIWH